MEHANFIYAILPIIGLVGIVLTIIALIYIVDGVKQKCTKDLFTGFKIIIASLSMIIFTAIGIYKIENSPLIWTKTANESLVSLNDNNMMSGKIYARRGYINENLYYQYMVDVGCGGYVANKVPSNGTTIYIDNKHPRCEWYEVSQQWWIFKQWSTKWKLYVPDGTIGDSYAIDLQ